MRSLIFVIITLTLMVLSTGAVVKADEDREENTIDYTNIRELYRDIGAAKLFRLVMTRKEERAMYYHTNSLVASKSCEEPNAWYFEGLVEDDICQQMKERGLNVVCNTACPENRRTGIKCGLAHECCTPAEAVPDTKEDAPVQCNPLGGLSGIQYCSFNF